LPGDILKLTEQLQQREKDVQMLKVKRKQANMNRKQTNKHEPKQTNKQTYRPEHNNWKRNLI